LNVRKDKAHVQKILDNGMFDLCPAFDSAYHLLIQFKMKSFYSLWLNQ